MYDIGLTINGVSLRMNHGTGYDIASISGLTGTTARLNTVQSNIYIGENYTNGTVSGISLNIKGKILDGNTAKKQALIDTVLPLGEGTLTIYRTPESGRSYAYRTIDVVVQATPTITQEYHSKFALTLYAPKPIWKSPTAEAIALSGTAGNSNTQDVTISGQTAADYSMYITILSGNLKELSLEFGEQPSPWLGKWLYLNFRKYDENGITTGTNISLSRVKGKLELLIGGVKHNECIYSQSTLDSLDIGEHAFVLAADASLIARITYNPSYVGVLVDGV